VVEFWTQPVVLSFFTTKSGSTKIVVLFSKYGLKSIKN